MVRRVGSLRAEKVASRLVEYLTIRLCILMMSPVSRGNNHFVVVTTDDRLEVDAMAIFCGLYAGCQGEYRVQN